MGSLLNVVAKYELICKNDYIYTLSNGMEIKVVFTKNNLPHLLGLHKLVDIEELRKYSKKQVSANLIYKKLKSGEMTIEDLSKSEHFHEMKSRLDHIENLETLLFDRVVLDFDHKKIKTKLDKVKILFYTQIGNDYIHLPLLLGSKGSYIPNTFLVQDNRYYIENQEELNVVSLTVMNRGVVVQQIFYNEFKA